MDGAIVLAINNAFYAQRTRICKKCGKGKIFYSIGQLCKPCLEKRESAKDYTDGKYNPLSQKTIVTLTVGGALND